MGPITQHQVDAVVVGMGPGGEGVTGKPADYRGLARVTFKAAQE